jgi:translation initiation factor 2 beta subunit (eIF-2beta)/eIF-5
MWAAQNRRSSEMLTLHISNDDKNVLLPKAEFDKLIELFKKTEQVKIVQTELTDLINRLIALQELKRGETVNFDNVKEYWLRGDSTNV